MEQRNFVGIVNINEINVNYKLTNNFFNSKTNCVAHVEFTSYLLGTPNPLSSTGYKSFFLGIVTPLVDEMLLNNYKSFISEVIKSIMEESNNTIIKLSFDNIAPIQLGLF